MLSINDLLEITEEIKVSTQKFMKENLNFGEYVPEGKNDTKSIDLFAERALDKALEERGLSAKIISEEFGERIVGDDPKFMLVFDPVDGTTNAVRGISFYSTSLAYSDKTEDVRLNDLSMGVVASFLDHTYYAVRGNGAFIDGRKMNYKNYGDKLLISIHAYELPPFYREDLEKRIILRTLGSIALELCLVATGGLDIVLDTRNKLCVYDIAAGQLILRECGGYLIGLDGKDINDLVTSEGLSIIASSDKEFIKNYREECK